jgi:hypothetical protein
MANLSGLRYMRSKRLIPLRGETTMNHENSREIPTHFRFLHCSTGSVSSRTSENFSKWLRNVVLPDKWAKGRRRRIS